MTRFLERLIVLFALLQLCAIGLTVAFVFVIIASYFALSRVLAPPVTALVIAAGALVLTAISVAVGRFALRRWTAGRDRDSAPGRARAALLLGEILGKEAMEIADRYPGKTIAAGLLAGLAVGISPSLRKSLWKLFRR